jgi:Lon protease-like protein
MSDEKTAENEKATEKSTQPRAEKSYFMGDVGAGARVQQGENLNWMESYSNSPGGAELVQQFRALIKEINEHPELDEDTRAISVAKTEAVAEGLANAEKSPGKLKTALLDAKAWFTTAAKWGWDKIVKILKSDAAKKAIEMITEAGTKAAIAAVIGVPA